MVANKFKPRKSIKNYTPHVGYVGRSKMKVPNYLFATSGAPREYDHCKQIVELLSRRSIREECDMSDKLTLAMFRKGLTFSKHNKEGNCEFSVRCTPIILPMPEWLFDRIENGAQKLVASLRRIMQDIYGSRSPEDSMFIRSLDKHKRELFLNSIIRSPHYIPQLHHDNMKHYPFFDVVGMDLVLTDDLKAPTEMRSSLPVRLLELNAGSPSGASNNQYLLESLAEIDPEMLGSAGHILSNNHFEVMASVYKSLGETWTGRKDGIAIILAPGGDSGAAPEIHELARRSGLVYCDASDIFPDADGYLHVRDFLGTNPLVTSIYSRVNANSALFSQEKQIFLRDFESGKNILTYDPVTKSSTSKEQRSRASRPLQSLHMIPNLLEAVCNRRVYLGGLNRLLDDKCLLECLCTTGVAFCEPEIADSGINYVAENVIIPPPSLESVSHCSKELRLNSSNWVIKAPHLSGGSGIHILRCLSKKKRIKVVKAFARHPKNFAVQRLVTMAHIPVPTRSGNTSRYANVAADLRMWVFYGGAPAHNKPILTRNALVRTAPAEKGLMSSTVNTSLGGGYAPFAIVRTAESRETIEERVTEENKTKVAPQAASSEIIPLMAAVKIVQAARIAKKAEELLRNEREPSQTAFLVDSLRAEVREVACFFPQNCIERVQDLFEWKEQHAKHLSDKKESFIRMQQAGISDFLIRHRDLALRPVIEKLDSLSFWQETQVYGPRDCKSDGKIIEQIEQLSERYQPLTQALRKATKCRSEWCPISPVAAQKALALLNTFQRSAEKHFHVGIGTQSLATFFAASPNFMCLTAQCVISTNALAPKNIATLWEYATGKSLVQSGHIPKHLIEAREAWLRIVDDIQQKGNDSATDVGPLSDSDYIEAARRIHFNKFPFLRELQHLINKKDTNTVDEIMLSLQAAPYAMYNIVAFAERHNETPAAIIAKSLRTTRLDMNVQQTEELLFPGKQFLGEALFQKPNLRAQLSESKILVWVSDRQSPFSAAYTLGHELIHAYQLEQLQKQEEESHASPLGAALFCNLYANIFEIDFESFCFENTNRILGRHNVFGVKNILSSDNCNWIKQLCSSGKKGSEYWNRKLLEFGTSMGYFTKPRTNDKARACREVLASVENAKNIRFAKELGLVCPTSEYDAAMPCADEHYKRIHRAVVEKLITSTKPNWEYFRILANAQLAGVFFSRAQSDSGWSFLEGGYGAICIGGIASQTQ